MRVLLETLLAVIAFFAALYAINVNQQYADMVAGVKWCDIKFNNSTATAPCKINDNVAEVRM